jgi:PST family polysaccharide transporter
MNQDIEVPSTTAKVDMVLLKSRTIDGAFWNVGFAIFNKVITLVGQLMLAWFLMPADMGLANMALAMAAFTAILSVGGLGDVILQRRRYDQEAGQAFWLSLFFSTLMALAICSLAFVSPLIGKQGVKNLLWYLALATLIGAPATIMAAGLRRKMDFKNLAYSQFISGMFFTPATVLLAWWGFGPYSLIVPLAPKQLISMWVMWKKGGTFNFVKPMMSLSLSSLFTGLQTQAPIFVCGLILGANETGYFSWGLLVAGQVVFLLATNIREVLFPALTQMDDSPRRRAIGALKAARIMTAFLCVACGAQALLAKPLIHMFLPYRWYPAIPVVLIFSIGLVSQAFWISGMAWLNACGHYKKMLILSASQTVFSAGLTWFGSYLGGVWGAALGCSIAVLFGSAASACFLIEHIEIAYWVKLFKTIIICSLSWVVCFYLGSTHGFAVQLISAIIYIFLSALTCWEFDDGGIRIVADKIIILVKKIFT